MIETEKCCSSSESDELDRVPSNTYCVWMLGSVAPSPVMKKKRKSTGSSVLSFSRRFRLQEGRKKLILIASHPSTVENGNELRKSAVSPKRFVSNQRRSYLMYQKDVSGIFASVHETSRWFHSF